MYIKLQMNFHHLRLQPIDTAHKINQNLKSKIDKLVKGPKFRHACEGRYPELFENTGFPPSRE